MPLYNEKLLNIEYAFSFIYPEIIFTCFSCKF